MAEDELSQLIRRALASGVAQVQAAGGPVRPFFFDQDGTTYVLEAKAARADPLALAQREIREKAPGIRRCAVVMETRMTTRDRKRWPAILVVACEREAEEGEAWAQRYRARRLFRSFRAEPPEQVGKAKNFIRAALGG